MNFRFIAMVKDSSLVSLMGVWELSYRAIKIARVIDYLDDMDFCERAMKKRLPG